MTERNAVITDISEMVALVTQPSPLEVIASATKRDDVVPNYAQWIMEEDDGYPQDWHAINKAIMDKWSKAALSYIKERAWKLHREWYA